MKIKLNCDLLGNKKGDIIEVEDVKNVPVDEFWRRRLKDSEIDNCIQIISKEKSSTEKSVKQKIKEVKS